MPRRRQTDVVLLLKLEGCELTGSSDKQISPSKQLNSTGGAGGAAVCGGRTIHRPPSYFQVKPKHLSCIGVCCFQLAARVIEEECDIPSAHEIIRISQCKCTASDLRRMETIIAEKLHFEFRATTALTFLHLYHAIVLCHTSER